MPELPEVETTRRGLVAKLEGRKLTAVIVRHPQLRWPVPADLAKKLCGRQLETITRRGKYLLFDFSGLTQIVHLGMSGSLRFVQPDEPPGIHDHVDWVFAGAAVLRLRDPRRFGAVLLSDDPAGHALLAHLGPEPLSDGFDGEYLYRVSRGARIAVKNFVMDSKRVVGVGNIYASESLFAAGIRPGTAAGRLTRPACERLAQGIKAILRAAIKAGGSSLRDYVSTGGELGYFQLHTRVYDREGQPCRNCGAVIKRVVQGQRATFYCPKCQRH
jgi:formamidopyrimidine-DNA glycosylase